MTPQTIVEEVAEFEEYAQTYSELLDDPVRTSFTRDPLHFYWRKWIVLQRLFKVHDLKPESLSWLDVGCGRGELLSMIGDKFAQAGGCDPSSSMLPRNSRFQTVVQPSQTELPFRDHSVDFVTAVCVLHHVHGAHREALMQEVRRVLRPSGHLCIVEHNPWNPITRLIVKRCPIDVDAELHFASQAARLAHKFAFRTVGLDYFLYLPESLFNKFGAVEGLFRKLPLGGQYALLLQAPA